MAKSHVVEVKEQVIATLKQHYPDRYKAFKFKTDRWSTGGAIDITWIDGPAETDVDKRLASLKAHTGIMIQTHRKYSHGFIHRVAQEYTSVKGCEMPGIVTFQDGTCWLDNDYSKDIPYKALFAEMQRIDGNDIPTLAYRLYLINDVWTPIKTRVVRRLDYSHCTHPDYAVVREHSYKHPERKLFKVRRRINRRWVEVVEFTSLRHADSAIDVELHLKFLSIYGRQ